MKISDQGLDLIKTFEGIRLDAYRPVKGDVWTIGYGHTGKEVEKGDMITPRDAERFLRIDLERFEKCVNTKVKVPISQNQFDALVSLAFNIGCGAFGKSTLLRHLNGIPAQIMRWNKFKGKPLRGLTRRRKAESALYKKEDNV